MKKLRNKSLSLLLCAALILTMLPGITLQADAAGLNSAAIRLDANNSFGMLGAGKNWVYFGQYNGSPNKWRVLSTSKSGSYYYDNAGSEYNGNILFLMSEKVLGNTAFKADNTGNAYQGSDLQAYCNTILYGSCFSTDEQAAILSTTKEAQYDSAVLHWGSSPLVKDKLFSLSVSEATNSSYGFNGGTFNLTDTARRLSQIWQLRSPNSDFSTIAGVVSRDGSITNGLITDANYVRPAFNMNLTPVLFASAAQGGKSAIGMESGLALVPGTAPIAWKLTLLDSARSFSATPSSATLAAGSTMSVDYTSAASGPKEYVSAMLVDAAGNALYYGRVKTVADSGSENGTADIVIPSDLHAGSYTLKVFSEQYNGDNNTDFASVFSNVALTVTTETTPPTVQSVTPATGTGMNPASLSINFSEVMDTAIAGTITLNNGATASTPQWSTDKKTVTYTISGIAYSTTYDISISGFRDKAGNIMAADTSHNYVTDALKYMDENGAAKTATATKINSSTASLETGWYVVDSNVTKNGTLLVTGDVKLILADGCTLTVSGSSNDAGVSVTTGNSLTIFGQSAGTGKLIAYGDGDGAGIGGKRYVNGGAITINGGTVTAKGGGYGGAGIGGGVQASGGTIIINAGTVTANGGTCGAGIGSGSYLNNNGSVTINGGTVLASGGAGGSAGIGGGYRGSGGTVTITGGFLWANGTGEIEYGKIVRLAAGIGSGAGGGGVIATISGGSVNASVQSTPKNGTANGNAEVKLTKIHLAGVNAITGVTALTFNKAYTYGMKDLHTDANGDLFLHLPSGVSVKSAEAGSTVYWGLVTAGTTDGALSQDSTAPSVNSVTTSGTTALSVTFSEAMDTTIAGTVTLNNGAAVSSPQWGADCKSVTYSLTGIGYNKTYSANATGFQDIAGHAMTAYSGSFTTEPEPLTPNVSPGTLTVNKGGTASFTMSFGQGITAATGASISVGNGSVVSISQNHVTTPGAITVTGLAIGTTDITVTFNDLNKTKKTVSVTVSTNAASSGGGSSSSASSSTGKTYQADFSTGGAASANLQVSVDTAAGRASVAPSSDQGKALADGGSIKITMPSVSGVTGYAVTLPVSSLKTEAGGTLSLKSDAGNMIIPSNMLSTFSGSLGQTATVSSGRADTSALSDKAKAAVGNRPVIQLTLLVDGTQVEWNNPNAPVTVSIPYTPTAEELKNSDSIIVWYIDGSGKPVCVPSGHYDAVNKSVTFETTHFSLYSVGYHPVSFNDVVESAWYDDAVSFLAARSITSGTSNGSYSPDKTLTRGEFIVMLMRAYGITEDKNPTNSFTDAGNTYYTGYLATAKRLGISNGVGNNLFAPEKEITRQEMFTLLYQALKNLNQVPEGASGKTLSDFSDSKDVSSWAKDAMALLVETGAISGKSGKLTPASTTTRAEMAQVLYNLLGK